MPTGFGFGQLRIGKVSIYSRYVGTKKLRAFNEAELQQVFKDRVVRWIDPDEDEKEEEDDDNKISLKEARSGSSQRLVVHQPDHPLQAWQDPYRPIWGAQTQAPTKSPMRLTAYVGLNLDQVLGREREAYSDGISAKTIPRKLFEKPPTLANQIEVLRRIAIIGHRRAADDFEAMGYVGPVKTTVKRVNLFLDIPCDRPAAVLQAIGSTYAEVFQLTQVVPHDRYDMQLQTEMGTFTTVHLTPGGSGLRFEVGFGCKQGKQHALCEHLSQYGIDTSVKTGWWRRCIARAVQPYIEALWKVEQRLRASADPDLAPEMLAAVQEMMGGVKNGPTRRRTALLMKRIIVEGLVPKADQGQTDETFDRGQVKTVKSSSLTQDVRGSADSKKQFLRLRDPFLMLARQEGCEPVVAVFDGIIEETASAASAVPSFMEPEAFEAVLLRVLQRRDWPSHEEFAKAVRLSREMKPLTKYVEDKAADRGERDDLKDDSRVAAMNRSTRTQDRLFDARIRIVLAKLVLEGRVKPRELPGAPRLTTPS